jgi:hypothetical protein
VGRSVDTGVEPMPGVCKLVPDYVNFKTAAATGCLIFPSLHRLAMVNGLHYRTFASASALDCCWQGPLAQQCVKVL